MEVLHQLKGRITIVFVSSNPTLLELADQTIRLRGGAGDA